MKILSILLKKSKKLIFLSIALSIFSASINIFLISMLNQAIKKKFIDIDVSFILIFLSLAFLATAVSVFSQRKLINMGLSIARDLRLLFANSIAYSSALQVERVGQHKLFASITQDVGKVADGISFIPGIMVNIFACIAGVIYMFFLSPQLLIMIVFPALIGAYVVRLMSRRMRFFYSLLRDSLDSLYKSYDGLIKGYKELQINTPLETHFHKNILQSEVQSVYELGFNAQFRWALMTASQNLLFFLLIGSVLIISVFNMDQASSSFVGCTLVILYLREPITALVYALPATSQASVALQKIKSLDLASTGNTEYKSDLSVFGNQGLKSIRLSDVEYVYKSSDLGQEKFRVGPISLKFNPGEIVFIVGGNGSGKSTLGKVLSGLYEPVKGKIYLNEQEVNNLSRPILRNSFAVIFSDYYLFEHVVEGRSAQLVNDSRAFEHLKKLGLDRHVQVVDGKLSTVTELSQGQKKRLALLMAFISDRPIFLFDEWASDQDPVFKRYFYEKILHELKAQGKCVIVISHDDKYFYISDRVLKMSEGKLL